MGCRCRVRVCWTSPQIVKLPQTLQICSDCWVPSMRRLDTVEATPKSMFTWYVGLMQVHDLCGSVHTGTGDGRYASIAYLWSYKSQSWLVIEHYLLDGQLLVEFSCTWMGGVSAFSQGRNALTMASWPLLSPSTESLLLLVLERWVFHMRDCVIFGWVSGGNIRLTVNNSFKSLAKSHTSGFLKVAQSTYLFGQSQFEYEYGALCP